jgi:mono/diheme cytochrome c family protein
VSLQGHDQGTRNHERGGGGVHYHAPVPPEYRAAHVPAAVWTNAQLLARGKEIYASRCAVCHGEQGDGRGPAAMGLPIAPPSFRDPTMVGEMAGNYWFWRISEGGLVEPFRSMGSVMPAWKHELPIDDRWAVIAYTHRFSGHDGPHVTSEHPEMLMGGRVPPGDAASGGAASAPKTRSGSTHGSREHGEGRGGVHKH